MNDVVRYIPGAPRKVSLDEAFALAQRVGKPTVGPSFRHAQAAELKLHETYAADHYVLLKCDPYDTAAENLMALVAVAEQLKPILTGS